MRTVPLALLLIVLSAVSVRAYASDRSRDWSSLPPDARSGILAALKHAEGKNGNWMQLATLRASNGQPTAAFGFSVAVDGDTVVVGAPYIGFYKGEVYVFVKPASGWTKNMTETARLSTSDGGNCTRFTTCQFGYSVAIRGDTVVVGTGADQGDVYVFVKPATGWKTTSKFNAKLTVNVGNTRVATNGDTVVAGAQLAHKRNGVAFVFVKPTGGWKGLVHIAARLTASDGKTDDSFGCAVGTDGDAITVGAFSAGSSSIGQAYVFVRPAGGWKDMTETARLMASDGQKNYELGWSVAMSGNTVIAGAPNASTKTGTLVGITYVFVKPATGWTDMFQTAELTASDTFPSGGLGFSVSLSGKTVAAGDTYTQNFPQGAVYLFKEPAGGWRSVHETTVLSSSNGVIGDVLGYSVAIAGNTVIAGAPDAVKNDQQGAAYVFGQQ